MKYIITIVAGFAIIYVTVSVLALYQMYTEDTLVITQVPPTSY